MTNRREDTWDRRGTEERTEKREGEEGMKGGMSPDRISPKSKKYLIFEMDLFGRLRALFAVVGNNRTA